MRVIRQDTGLTKVIQHIDVQYAKDDEVAGVDQYDEQGGLPRLIRLCTNLQSIRIEGFSPLGRSAHFVSKLYRSFHTCGSLTTVEISRFKADKLSDLCDLLSSFPNLTDIKGLDCELEDLETLYANSPIVDFDSPALAHLVPEGLVPFDKVRSLVFNTSHIGQGSDILFIDLLGSSHTLFPKLELLNYHNNDVPIRMQRLLKRLQGSLKTLQLGTDTHGTYIS